MKKTKTAGSTAPANQSAVASYDWSKVGTSGFEHVQQDDLGIPFLSIIQDGSPEFKRSDPHHVEKKIEGCGPGDIFNTLSRQILYKQGGAPLLFIPCSYEKLFVEWTPREEGGGIVKTHRNANILNETKKDDKGRDVHQNGNLIVTTAYFYGIVMAEDENLKVVIGLKSTQLKKARALLNIATSIKFDGPSGKFTPPLFSHSYQLGTQAESNNEGSWWGWTVSLNETVQDPVLIADAIETSRRSSQQARPALAPPENVPFA